MTGILAAMLMFSQNAFTQPSFTKQFLPDTIGPGSVSTLRFVIDNSGGLDPATDLAFTDNLPAGLSIATPAAAATTCGGDGIVSAPDGGSAISFSGGTVGAGGSCTVQVNVTGGTPGTHTNVSGDLTSSAGSSGTATDDLTINSGRPGFSKSFSPSTVAFGGRSTLTFTIDNSANASSAFNLAFNDSLPSGMTVASPANASTTCTSGVVTANPGASAISLSAFGGTLAAGASCTVSIDVIGGAAGSLDNVSGELTFTVSGPTLSSGKAGAVLEVVASQINLIKRFTDDPVPAGGSVNLEFTILNRDRGNSATNIAFSDDLDAALSGLVATGLPQAACGGTVSGTDTIVFSGGSLAPEGECSFSVTLQVPVAAATGNYPNTTTAITATIGGSPEVGDPASDILFVQPAPILTKSFTDDPVGAGGTVELEFTIINTSPNFSATGIAFSDEFNEIIRTASSVPAAGFCGAGSTALFIPHSDFNPNRLIISGASLDPGASCTFSIDLDVVAGAPGGVYPNITSSISATVDGAAVTGNPAEDDLTVVEAPFLTKEFIDDPVVAGNPATLRFILAHDELAPDDAADIAFSDDLTATLSDLAPIGLPMSNVCGTGSELTGTTTSLMLTGGLLAPGESCQFDVTLSTPMDAPSGDHQNTTSNVTATVGGIAVSGNPAADVLKIAGLTLVKEFIGDPVLPGGTVTLRFTIENVSATENATSIIFTDDLDDVISGLTATGLPMNDVCGTGSTLSAILGNTRLVFSGGSLAAGDSCFFDVTLQVPGGAASDVYVNTTAGFSATLGGATVLFDNASDELTVSSDQLLFSKSFTDDPVLPGGVATLEFTIDNLNPTQAVSDIAFTDDLDAALSGLAATGLPQAACGGTVSGTDTIAFSGGSLGAGASCSFSVSVAVPAGVAAGTSALNTTGQITGMIDGLEVTGDPASDSLKIGSLDFSKSFDGPAFPGGEAVLTFHIQNMDDSESVSDLSFSDDLDAMLSGAVAIGLPESDVCGTGSLLSGASVITLTGGNLLAGGSCTFGVNLSIPASALPGTYVNTTSELLVDREAAAEPAAAELTIPENLPPDCGGAEPSISELWPPNHQFVEVALLGVTDPDGDELSVRVARICQDELADAGTGDGNHAPDGMGVGNETAEVRAERQSGKIRMEDGSKVKTNGRVYHIFFDVEDGRGGSCEAEVTVGVPRSMKRNNPAPAVDDGALYDSTNPQLYNKKTNPLPPDPDCPLFM
ncbi:MAG: DUF7933 domain-containing protein [Gammaproteobacteria bacterium]